MSGVSSRGMPSWKMACKRRLPNRQRTSNRRDHLGWSQAYGYRTGYSTVQTAWIRNTPRYEVIGIDLTNTMIIVSEYNPHVMTLH